jgi:two-component system, OmpR family, sensor kinase
VIRRPHSLRFRVLAVAVLLVVVGMVAVNLMAFFTLRSSLLAKVDQGLLAVPAGASVPATDRPGLPPIGGRGPTTSPDTSFINNLVITILNGSTGTVINRLVGPAVRNAPRPDLSGVIAAIRSGHLMSGLSTVGGAGYPGYQYRIRVISREGGASSVVVVATSLADLRSTLARVAVVDSVVSLVLLGALIAIGRPVMRVGLRPLTEVDEAAARIGAGDLSVRVPHADEQGEVGHLSRTFNEMAGEIEQAFREQRASDERLRRFVSDASHEIRTPLSTIRAYAELLRQGTLPVDPESQRAARRIEAEASRMGALVNDLLLLARLDERRTEVLAPVEVDEVVSQLAGDTAATAPGHRITCDVEPHAVVMGEDVQLRQLVGNLLRNAVVHTPEGTTVGAWVRRTDHRVEIVIEDDGPGMPPDVAEHAFERFFRPQPGRARAAGAGLGLAIVDSIATAHNGSVELETAPGRGARFTVSLPAMPEARETCSES